MHLLSPSWFTKPLQARYMKEQQLAQLVSVSTIRKFLCSYPLSEKCFASVTLLPRLAKIASTFCSPYIKFTPPFTTISTAVRTSVVTNTVTTSVTLAGPIATQLVTISPPPVTVLPTCAISLVPFSTSVGYPTLGANLARGATTAAEAIPTSLAAGCGTGNALTSKISSACSYYLGTTKTVIANATSITTSTAVVLSTVSLPGQVSALLHFEVGRTPH